MHCNCFKNFEDLIFVDDKLPAKTAKIMLYMSIYYSCSLVSPYVCTVALWLATVASWVASVALWLVSEAS